MLDIAVFSDYNSCAAMKCHSLTSDAVQRTCFANELVEMRRESGNTESCISELCISTDFLSHEEVYKKPVHCSMWNKMQIIIRAGQGSVLSWIDSCNSVVSGESEISAVFQHKDEDEKCVCSSSNDFDYGQYHASWASGDCTSALTSAASEISGVNEHDSEEKVINYVERLATVIFAVSLSVFLIAVSSRLYCLFDNIICIVSAVACHFVYDTANNGCFDSVFCEKGRYSAI